MCTSKPDYMTDLNTLIEKLIKSGSQGFSNLSIPQKLLYEIKIKSLKERELDILKQEVRQNPAVIVFIESILRFIRHFE